MNSANIQKAADLAHLLMLSGEDDRAGSLLDTVISFYDANYTKGSANFPMGIAKVDALALRGREADALEELQRVVDVGWRLLWRWDTEHNRNLDSLRDSPKFDSIIAWIEDDLKEQARQFAEKEL